MADKPTRRETKAHVKAVQQRIKDDTKDIRHSDQAALGISTDAAMDAVRRGQDGGAK